MTFSSLLVSCETEKQTDRQTNKTDTHFCMERESINIECKIVLLGSTDVGKTAISVRYAEGIFPMRPLSTVGASFLTKNVNVDGNRIKFQIWDTAGQERFRSLASMYYRGASVAILVFDVSSQKSFDKIKEWVQELKINIQEDIVMIVCGNKIDKERVVDRDIAKTYADDIKALYYETSAKMNEGIDVMFLEIAKRLLIKHHILLHNQRSQQHHNGVGVNPRGNINDSMSDYNRRQSNHSSNCCS
ncbi:Rab GTPase [Cavenderia fasciculata]|uniref:Rab GTPase n=1 Tax=Cavenderia fasciculata TaxID=261658 RepID=F4Q3M7_CACFS|nr:Rab GTPase [Cavenderia fasciculata]EGG17685.1 Rab GTPase [Cavenderia fasciculata]|eukprot:XP_004356169.1 Rab GTPase [Cavenderia fasciculata]